MKRFKLLFGLCIVAFTVFLVYSCAKESDNVASVSSPDDTKVEIRESGSACSPQTLYTEYDRCSYVTKTDKTISFAAIDYALYPNLKIHQLCPDLEVKVSYTLTTCYRRGEATHFIHDLTYDLPSMIEACPALEEELMRQFAAGELESFLDLIDHEISRQTEFTEAFEAASDAYLYDTKYSCEKGNEFYSVKYIKNTCYEWVDFEETDFPVVAKRKQDCGASVCCARSTSYCVQTFVDKTPVLQISKSPTYQKFEGDCPEGRSCTHDCGGKDLDAVTM